MTDWVKEVMGTRDAPAAPAESFDGEDWVKIAMGTDVNTGKPKVERVPKPKASTVSGEPIQNFVIESESPGAGAGALLKANWVNDPVVKAGIYATSRFPDMDPKERMGRYAVQNGAVYFKDDDGKWRAESPKTFSAKAKDWFVNPPAWISALLSGAGEMAAGPAGGIAGSALGEGLRQAVATNVFGEHEDILQRAFGIGAAALPVPIGQTAGRTVIPRGTNWFLRRGVVGRENKLARLVQDDLAFKNNAEANARLATARQYGMGDAYTPAMAFDSPTLYGAHEALRVQPGAATVIEGGKQRATSAAARGQGQFLDEITPGAPSSEVAERLIQASKGVQERQADIRATKARPYYEKAHAVEVPDALAGDLLSDPVVSDAVKYVQSSPIYQREIGQSFEAVNNLKIYDYAKRRIDDQIEAARRAGNNNEARLLAGAKSKLIERLDELSPDYRNARKIFGDYSLELERTGKKTTLGRIAAMEGDDTLAAVDRLFNPAKNTPERLAAQIKQLNAQDPGAVPAGLRMYLQDMLVSRAPKTGGPPNLAGHFYQTTVGDPNQMAMLRVALKDQPWMLANLERLGEVMRTMGRIYGSNSDTAGKLAFDEKLRSIGGISRFMSYVRAPLQTMEENQKRRFMEENALVLAQALTSPKAAVSLQRASGLKPGSKKWIEAVSTALAAAAGQNIEDLPYQIYGTSKQQPAGNANADAD